ncbi:hypothetical protein [Labrys neptuniae]
MAKARYCPRTAYLRRLIEQGRIIAAKQQAGAWLREAYASPQFLSLIAELLDPAKPDRDRRNRRPPAQWLDIGEAFDAIREDGFTRDQTILILSDRFHRSAGLIDKALDFYRDAQRPYSVAPTASAPLADTVAGERA